MADEIGLERYREIRPLGSGGMATVVLAEDTMLGRRVALKRMHSGGDARGVSRLRREALAGASLSHPNLVSVYDVLAVEDGEQVIVMEYVDGETLHDALTRESGLPVDSGLRILDGVSAALDAIHRHGIVHRDVKPANILLGLDGAIKLADLGIASVADRTQITTDGAVLGTFSYMAPEQLEGAPATPAVDVYALAAVAFEVLSGRKAHAAPNPVALAHAISTQPPPDLLEAWPAAPPAAAELLVRGMSRAPEQRPRSAGELTGRLRAALESQPTAPVNPPTPPTPERKQSVSAVADGGKGALATRARPLDAFAPARRRRLEPATAPRRPSREPPPSRRPSRPANQPPAAPVASGDRRARRGRLGLGAGLIALVALGIGLAALLGAGSSPRRTAGGAPAGHRSASAGAPARTTAGSSAPTTASAGSGAAGAGAGDPVSAVKSFYTLAASHQYRQAWAIADPAFQRQLQGYQSFESGQAGDRSITFDAANVVNQSPGSATVAVKTTSVRTDGTHHCAGTVDLRPGGAGSWLLHQIHINCS